MDFGDTLMSGAHRPRVLVAMAVRAEDAGFSFRTLIEASS
jgi:hypothetical protein